MAKRPINTKRARRVRKLLRNELPKHLDLVQWLKDHGHAQTTGKAEEIILAKRVKSESHVIGVTTAKVPTSLTFAQIAAGRTPQFEEREVVQRYVPARLRASITVI